MVAQQANNTKNFRPEDLAEEALAGEALKALLTGKQIDPNYPPENEAHQFKPTDVKLTVALPPRGSKHDGSILEVAIHQIDRHHPELVRELLIKEFAKIAPLAPFPLSSDDITHDPIRSVTTAHFQLPKGKADEVIHALSELAPKSELPPKQEPAPEAEATSWVERTGRAAATPAPCDHDIEASAPVTEPAQKQGWMDKMSGKIGRLFGFGV